MKPLQFTLITLLVCIIPSFAQTPKSSSLEVKGEAHLKVKPDLDVITISFTAMNMIFNKAVKEVNDKNDVLIKQLEKNGFKKEEIKSSGFTAGKNTIWGRDESIDSGYLASQTIVLEFAYSKERVTKLIESFSQSTIDLAFNFNFILSDSKTKETRNKLIELSVADAKEKAEIIAKSATLKLGTIQSIQHGNTNSIPPQPLMYKAMDSNESTSSGFGGLNVSDIEIADEIFVVWSINQ
jgi:uncharacterized protein YggE